MARVFLVGFMGSGKTTSGRLLAVNMGFDFIDLDKRIEAAAGASVARIFELEGEAGFRKRETGALRAACRQQRIVVATGGGAMIAAENRELMAARGTTVWLNADFEVLLERLARQPAGQRPLFVDPRQARTLFESRLGGYRQADLEVDVGSGEDAASVAERIAGLLREERCAT